LEPPFYPFGASIRKHIRCDALQPAPLWCRFGAGLVQERNDGFLSFYRGFPKIGAGLKEKQKIAPFSCNFRFYFLSLHRRQFLL